LKFFENGTPLGESVLKQKKKEKEIKSERRENRKTVLIGRKKE